MNDQFAVIDLGSNSFRLLLARRRGGALHTVERMKDKVQLARGLRHGRFEASALDRADGALRRFAERLGALDRSAIAVVGTHPLRAADDPGPLATQVRRTLGVPLRVLPTVDEAALVYRGVERRDPCGSEAQRLVIDLGGGSAEYAWGRGAGLTRIESIPVGCVSLADDCFAAGSALQVGFEMARAQLADRLPDFGPLPPRLDVIGTSGTVESVQAVLSANGWGDRTITREGLDRLVSALFEGRFDPETGMLGLAPERIDIFPAGVALLDMVFRQLGIDSMRYVDAALEDGVLDELAHGPTPQADSRRSTVRALQQRFDVDQAQAARVRDTALGLFDAVAPTWSPDALGFEARRLLAAAAELHEIGLAVSVRGYHRHGAYLLRFADLPGFRAQEQTLLTALIRAHRRALPALSFAASTPAERRLLLRLVALLRLAVVLHRGHADGDVPPIASLAATQAVAVDRPQGPSPEIAATAIQVAADTTPDGDELSVRLPGGWLAAHPLAGRELNVEATQLATAGIRLRLLAP